MDWNQGLRLLGLQGRGLQLREREPGTGSWDQAGSVGTGARDQRLESGTETAMTGLRGLGVGTRGCRDWDHWTGAGATATGAAEAEGCNVTS